MFVYDRQYKEEEQMDKVQAIIKIQRVFRKYQTS